MILCPSDSNFFFMFSVPPGYFGLSTPPVLSVRQYGVMFFTPSDAASSAA